MWLDVIAVVVLLVFAWMGARRGGLASGMSLATLAVSYAVAIAAASLTAPWLARQFDFSELVMIPLMGTLGFGAGFAAMAFLSGAARRRFASDEERSVRDRFLGSAFGAVRGALLVFLLSYLAIWVDALRVTGVAEELPEIGDSAAAAVTETVVESFVESAMEDSGRAGRVIARLASHPGAALVDLQAVVENRHIAALQEDRLFWANVEAGAVGSALNTRTFINLSYDEELRRQMAAIGLIGPEAAEDPDLFRAAIDEVLREVAPRIRNLRNDPAIQELLSDPEVIAMVESGNTFGLIRHPGIRELVARVSETPTFD